MGGVLRIKDAERGVLLDLEEDLKEGFFREEEEPQPRRVWRRQIRGYGDGRDGHRDTARVGESKFLEEDHGAVVGDYFKGFDLGDGEWDEGEDEKGEGEYKKPAGESTKLLRTDSFLLHTFFLLNHRETPTSFIKKHIVTINKINQCV